jgi:aconitase B
MLFHCPSSFRSPTFRAILTADTSGRIEMKKTSLKTGQDLVHYIYNRQLRNGSDLVGLLALAAHYNLEELRAECAQKLAATINKVSSVCWGMVRV